MSRPRLSYPLRRARARLAKGMLALLLAGAASPDRASAEAALAVGLPGDVAKQGVAVGWAVNHASKKTAEAEALKRCREAKEPPQAARDLCRIVESFEDRCVAVALDPEAGTSGIGWAVAAKQKAAEDAAIGDCAESAGAKRRAACRIALARCDGR